LFYAAALNTENLFFPKYANKWGGGTEEVVITKQRKVVIQRSKFRGAETLDIRTWLETPKYRGFTRKGINIPIEKGEELARKILNVIKSKAAGPLL
jgi:hypothetical protein